MPRSAAARAILIAISPRLAMRSFWKAMEEEVRLRDSDQPDSAMVARQGGRESTLGGPAFARSEWASPQSHACKDRAPGRAEAKDRLIVLVEEVFHSPKHLGLIVQVKGP